MLTAILNVKNESALISRCLTAAAQVADAFLITDTGSTDGTQDIVINTCRALNKPLRLLQSDWPGWSTARSKLFAEARALDPNGYSLLLDADEMVTVVGRRAPLTDPGYYLCRMWAQYWEVWGIRLLCNSSPWQWQGEIHELPVLPGYQPQQLHWFEVKNENSRVRSSTPEEIRARYLSEALHFRDLLDANPSDTRAAYYYAQSLKDAGEPSTRAYQHRLSMDGGFQEERYLSALELARVDGDFDRAIRLRPQRFEARVEKAYRLIDAEKFTEAHEALLDSPGSPSGDLFLVHRPSETWMQGFLSALLEARMGNVRRARLIAIDTLDVWEEIPHPYRTALESLANAS